MIWDASQDSNVMHDVLDPFETVMHNVAHSTLVWTLGYTPFRVDSWADDEVDVIKHLDTQWFWGSHIIPLEDSSAAAEVTGSVSVKSSTGGGGVSESPARHKTRARQEWERIRDFALKNKYIVLCMQIKGYKCNNN